MKLILALALSLTIANISCTKHHQASPTPTYTYTGSILGPDLTMTFCSGGYFIQIPALPRAIRFDALPTGAGFSLTPSTTYPISVRLNCHLTSPPNQCGVVVIDVIERVY